MLLDELHMDCFEHILEHLPDADIRTLFDTNYKLASLIIACIGGPPAKMLTLRNVSGRAEAVYHATSKELIYSRIDLDSWFYSNAVYEVVNVVISYPMEVQKVLQMLQKLQRKTSHGIINKWKQLNLICTQNAVITEDLADDLCKYELHSFACSAENISRDVTFEQFLRACRKAENIWIMSPRFTTDFMDALKTWEYEGDSECSIVFQNPSHEASIIELPPEEFIIDFCENFPSHKLLFSVVVDTEEFEPDTLPNYVEILGARLPHFEVSNTRNRLVVKNISMSSFELFVIAANVLRTPTEIFLFEEDGSDEDDDNEVDNNNFDLNYDHEEDDHQDSDEEFENFVRVTLFGDNENKFE